MTRCSSFARLMVLSAAAFFLILSRASFAFDPETDHVCVYNCDGDDSDSGVPRSRNSSPPPASPEQIARWKSWQLNHEAIALDNAGRQAEALAKLQQAMEADPTNQVVEGNYYCVKAGLELNDNAALASADAQRAAQLEPTKNMLDWVHWLQNQAEAIQRTQANKASANQAYDLVQQKRYAEAIAILNQLAVQAPTSVWVQQTLANAYRDLAEEDEHAKRWDDEINAFEGLAGAWRQLRQIDPDYSAEEERDDLYRSASALVYGGALENYDFEHDPSQMDPARIESELNILREIQRLDPNSSPFNRPIADVISFYSRLEAKVESADAAGSRSASHQLPDVAANSAAASQVPQTQGITRNLNGPDEIAKARSDCGFGGGSGCETTGSTIPPFQKTGNSPAVAALENNIGPVGLKDPAIQQSVGWFASTEKRKSDTAAQLAEVKKQLQRGEGDAAVLKAEESTLKNEIKQDDRNEASAKAAIKKRLVNLGLSWNAAPDKASGQN